MPDIILDNSTTEANNNLRCEVLFTVEHST